MSDKIIRLIVYGSNIDEDTYVENFERQLSLEDHKLHIYDIVTILGFSIFFERWRFIPIINNYIRFHYPKEKFPQESVLEAIYSASLYEEIERNRGYAMISFTPFSEVKNQYEKKYGCLLNTGLMYTV